MAFREAQIAVDDARRVGIDNFSMDMIYGIPGQTMLTWEKSLEDVLSLSPRASLAVCTDGGGGHAAVVKGSGWEGVAAPDDDLAADLYDRAREVFGRPALSITKSRTGR